MPTRLPVLLHRLKSAAAGWAKAIRTSGQRASATGQRNAPATLPSTLIALTRIIRSTISRRFHVTVNEDGAEVIDVGEGGARTQQVAQALEEARGVVVGKKRGRIEAKFLGPGDRLAVDDRPGRVIGRAAPAVRTVGVGGKGRDAARARKADAERERIFLVRPAAPVFVPDCDGEF